MIQRSPMTEQQFLNLQKAVSNPVFYAEKVIGVKLEPYQGDVLEAIAAHEKVAWRSGHGVGKTAAAAMAVNWFFDTRPNSKTITTASSWRQVSRMLWPEIHKWRRRADFEVIGRSSLDYEPLKLMLSRDEDWFATGEASDEADKMEGFHSKFLFYVIDEGKSVPLQTYEAIEGALTNEEGEVRVLVISTPPPEKTGYFYEIFSKKRIGWQTFHTSSLDSQRVSRAWVEQRKQEWGEDSAVYINRVLGEFAESGQDALIPLSKIEAAVENKDTSIEGKKKLGMDVARYGEDSTIIVRRQGNCVLKLSKFIKEDTMQSTGRLLTEMKDFGAELANIDAIGIGAGVVDRAAEQRDGIHGVNSAEGASDSEKFLNKRAEMYWGLRQRFLDGDISIPDDEELIGQLSNIKYKYNSRGQLQIESKDDMKKRGLKSPDKADALALAFYDLEDETVELYIA